MNRSKPFWESTTLWLNAIMGAAAAAIAVVDKTMVPAEVWPWIVVVSNFLNFLNRFLTKVPIKAGPTEGSG